MKVRGQGTQSIAALRSRPRVRMTFASALVLLSSVYLTACFSNGVKKTNLSSNSNPLSGIITSYQNTALTISRVIKSASSPSSTFDITGDGSGTLGASCSSTGSGAGNLGQSTCNCSYTYQTGTGATENFEAPTTYHENDLIRCLYVGIPAATTQVKVKVHVLTSDSFSNELTFDFGNSNSLLNTSLASTFIPVQRYQCRDEIWIPNIFDPSSIYDPFQSEDPRNTYPLNFYTTNMGAALSIFVGGVAGAAPPNGWYCPPVPNDPAAGIDLRLYSIGADSFGSKQIFPPPAHPVYSAGSFSAHDRVNFNLAKGVTGVFNLPLNAFIAPTIVTNSPDPATGAQSGAAPLGYAAAPIPTGTAGRETCPDASVPIPQGYHWVKVWLYRMALPTRKFVDSQTVRNMGNIDCAVGEWNLAASLPSPGDAAYAYKRSVMPDCYNKKIDTSGTNRGNWSVYLNELGTSKATGATLASRFIEGIQGAPIQKCVNIDPVFKPGGLTGPGNLADVGQGPGKADALYPGADIWQLNSIAYVTAAPPNCSGVGSKCVDYQAACNSSYMDPTHLCAALPAGSTAYDTSPTQNLIDTDAASNRYDFLFVVSPPDVMSGDITNLSSAAHMAYTPYRFMVQGDCNAADPDASGSGCLAKNALRNYGIKFHDVGLAGDPPASDPARPGTFPMCALQPD